MILNDIRDAELTKKIRFAEKKNAIEPQIFFIMSMLDAETALIRKRRQK